MEKKNNIKNLYIIFLIISLIAIIIMGFFLYKFYTDKQTANSKLEFLNNEVVRLQNDNKNTNDTFASLNDKINELQKTIDTQEQSITKSVTGIMRYEIQMHNYLAESSTNHDKYLIDSEDELNAFYSTCSDKLNINTNYLENNSIFIQVDRVGSGSIRSTLSAVTFENNTVNFIIDSSHPEIGTCDIAYWYFIAIIPNANLKNLDLSNWIRPSQIQ